MRLTPEQIAALELVLDALTPPVAADAWVDAAHAPISARAIRDAVRDGRLAGYRVGRTLLVKRGDLDAYIESRRVRPACDEANNDNSVTLLDRLGKRRAAG